MKHQPRKTYFPMLVLMLALPVMASAGVVVTAISPSTTTATVNPQTTISAKASSSNPITGWFIYSDNNPIWSAGAGSNIAANVTLSSGTRNIRIRAWDSTGAFGDLFLTLNVSST